MKKVFIDGKVGTTGLRIYERLEGRKDIQIIPIADEDRKNAAVKKSIMNDCDVVFMCLPDDAARESVSLIENPDVTVIDASTAHRTISGWAYGFPELSNEHRLAVQSSKRIAVPGCHASGFIALVYPLIEAGVLLPSTKLTCHSVTGYSGGGKGMIAQYENEPDLLLGAPRQYGLTQNHKHLKEMQYVTGIEYAPIFCPIVSNFYSGMVVTVPLFASDISCGIDEIKKIYKQKYNTAVVSYADINEGGFVSANGLHAKDNMQVSVEGNDDRILLIARYDNLGKGASGAAVQCLNIAMGADELTGLEI